MKQHYFGVVEAGSEGFGMYFPDFPGCVTGGDTLSELAANGHEALQFHIEGMVEDGEMIPSPSEPDLEAERAEVPEADLRALVAIEVEVPTFPDTVSVPLELSLIREVDGISHDRRKFIMDATRRELLRLKQSA
ncbi:MAG: type II toxin-antitoxin system HicB family antitoxin [Janthinobacterium lividum]